MKKIFNIPFQFCLLLLVSLPQLSANTNGFYYINHGTYIEIDGYSNTGETNLVIPDQIEGLPVTHIATRAFYEWNLQSVNLPDTLEVIGDSAFFLCEDLTTINLPESLKRIEAGALGGCVSLSALALPSNLEYIGGNAFIGIPITSLTIPASVTEIASNPMAGGIGIEEYFVEAGNTAYKAVDGVLYSADGTRLVAYPASKALVNGTYTIPDGTEIIGHSAFNGCSITTITIPASVTSVESYAFFSNTDFTSVYFEGDAPTLGETAFYSSSVSPTLYYYNTASGFTTPTWIGYDGPVTGDEDVYNTELIAETGTFGDVTYKNYFTHIEITGALAGVSNLVIPDTIEGLPVTVIGMGAFNYNHDLTDIALPESLLRIEAGAFGYMLSLVNINLPDSITYIGSQAFGGSMQLGAMDLPASLESISDSSPFYAPGITQFTIEPENPNFQTIDGVLYSKDGKTIRAYPAGNTRISYEILSTVENIGNSAFVYNQHLTSVTLPAGVTEIGDYAFYYAESLDTVHLNEGLETIGEGAFRFTDALDSIVFPSTVTALNGRWMFHNSGLSQAYFKGNAPTFGEDVFTTATNSVTVYYYNTATGFTTPTWQPYPGNVYNTQEIAQTGTSGTFTYSNHFTHIEITGALAGVSTLVIPDTVEGLPVTIIGHGAFYGNHDLMSITLPLSLERIEAGAFGYMLGLTAISLPDNVRYIGPNAFASSDNITILDLPENLESIGEEATFAIAALEEFRIEPTNSYFQTVNGVLYSKDGKLLHAYPANKLEVNYTLLTTTQEVTNSAFMNAQNLQHVIFPSGVRNIGDYAFYEARSLQRLDLNEGLETIGDGVFRFTDALEFVTFPSTLTSLGESVFYTSALSKAYFLGNAPSMQKQVFTHADSSFVAYYYSSSTGFTTPTWQPYPGNVYNTQEIAQTGTSGYFRYTNHFTHIEITEIIFDGLQLVIPDTIEGLPVTELGFGAVAEISVPFMTDLTLPSTLKIIRTGAISSSVLENMILPDGIEEIEGYAISANLSELNIPASLNTIGNNAFSLGFISEITVDAGNSSFDAIDGILFNESQSRLIQYPRLKSATSYNIPSTVSQIDTSAFNSADNLIEITIPDTVEVISRTAFYHMDNLEILNMGNGVTTIDPFAFSHCRSLRTILWSQNVLEIGESAFANCTSLTETLIPRDVETIGKNAFSGSTSLQNIYFFGNAPNIEINAFINTAPNLLINYDPTKSGFTTPTWEPVSGNVYSTVALNGYPNEETIGNMVYALAYPSYAIVERAVPGASTIVIPDTAFGLPVQYTADSAFHGNLDIQSITYNSLITMIGNSAFREALNLQTLVLPDQTETIGSNAFWGARGLTTMHIPAAVTTIHQGAFAICTSLTEFTIDPANQNFTVVDGVLFTSDMTRLVAYPAGKTATTYTIPNTVEEIDWDAFISCSSLTEIIIDPSNTSYTTQSGVLYSKDLSTLLAYPAGKLATSYELPASVSSILTNPFIAATALETITVNVGNSNFTAVDGVLFNSTGSVLEVYPAGKPDTTYTVPDGVTLVDYYAFSRNTSLTKLEFPASLSSTRGYALQDSVNLSSVVFNGDAPHIDNKTFINTSQQLTLYYQSGVTGFTTPTWQPLQDGTIYNTYEIMPTGADPWLQSFGIPANTDLATDTNGDGVSLLMEYALNLDPTQNNLFNLPKPTQNNSLLSFEFYAQADDVTYTVEMTTDFVTWTTTGVTVTPPDGDGMSTATIDISTQPGFMRLKVEQ